MTETSLLQAIETMMDRKLEPIREDMARMKQDLSGLRQEQATIRRTPWRCRCSSRTSGR